MKQYAETGTYPNTGEKRSPAEAKRFRRQQLLSLNRGKLKPLRFFERIRLWLAGRRDGKRGLPAEENGIWRSPYLDGEVRKYQEFCCRMWGRLQLEAEERRADIRRLQSAIPHTEALLREAREVLDEEKRSLALRCGIRRKGEESMTDAQVRCRRERELAPRLSELQSRVRALEDRLEREKAGILAKRSDLLEAEESTAMICRRVLEHTGLRAAAYWGAAMKYRPEGSAMPMTPTLEVSREAEADYRRAAFLLGENDTPSLDEPGKKEVA